MNATTIMEARDIGKTFGGKGFIKKKPGVQAVGGVSLKIRRGETLGIVR